MVLISSCGKLESHSNKQALNQVNSKSPQNKTFVSFAPSNTELVYAIGAEDSLTGTSTNCKFPKAALQKPRIGSFTSANFEKLARLKPDMALLVSGQEGLASQLDKHNFQAMVLPNTKLSDIASNMEKIGRLSHKEAKAEELSKEFQNAIAQFKAILVDTKRPVILFSVWINPTICIGGASFLDDVITTCGARNSTASFKSSYPKLTAEKVIESHPDIVVLPYEAQDEKMLSRPPWSSLKAVKSNRVIFLPDERNDHLSRPTMRILNGLHWLGSAIHPEKKDAIDQWLKSNNHLILNRDKHKER